MLLARINYYDGKVGCVFPMVISSDFRMGQSGSEKPGAPLKDISISVTQRTRSKKSKLSQISTSSAAPKNINLSSPPQATEDDAGDKSTDGPR